VTRLRAEQLGYRFYAKTCFSFSPKRSVSGAHAASSSTETESFSPDAKRPGHIADFSQHPSSAKIKNEWSCTSSPLICLRGFYRGNYYSPPM